MSSMRSVAVALVVVAAGCRGSSSGPSGDAGAPDVASSLRIASCDRSGAAGTCSEYDGTYLAQNENLAKTSCTRLGGTFVTAECPNMSIVGSCKLSSGESRKYYGTGTSAYDAERGKKECETTMRGTWQAR